MFSSTTQKLERSAAEFSPLVFRSSSKKAKTSGLKSAAARRRGVGLVELLIALAISAAILTSVAVATDASFKAYAVNEETSSQMHRDRIALNRISTYIRTCKQHAPVTAAKVTSFSAGTVVTDTGIAMFTDTGMELNFTYDSTKKQVLMKENGTSHVLLWGVQTFTVKMEPMQSSTSIKTGGGFDLLRRATIVVTTSTSGAMDDINESVDGQTISLSSSVMPRRNSW